MGVGRAVGSRLVPNSSCLMVPHQRALRVDWKQESVLSPSSQERRAAVIPVGLHNQSHSHAVPERICC